MRTSTSFSFFFFNDTATTEIYTLSLHDALPIWVLGIRLVDLRTGKPVTREQAAVRVGVRTAWQAIPQRIDPGPKARSPHETQQFRSEMEEARLRYADDEEARKAAFMRIYSKHKPSQPNM